MSIESWKAELYPKPACETTVEEAAEHSLQKWKGYLPENMARHSIEFSNLSLSRLPFASQGTCALCHHHWDSRKYHTSRTECVTCPLELIGEGCLTSDSLYEKTQDRMPEDIRAMVGALERAVEFDRAQRAAPAS